MSPNNISAEELHQKIRDISSDKNVTGIILFSPLPDHLKAHLTFILGALAATKDVEGRKVSVLQTQAIVPPTALAAMELLHYAMKLSNQSSNLPNKV